MKRKSIILMFVVFFSIAGFVYGGDYEINKKAGSYMVHVKMDKNPPVTGQNKVEISIQDAAGADVTDATVVVEYSMPAMPGMPAINYRTKMELKNGKYLASLNFSMSGAWNINIKITRAGKTQSVKLNVDVG